MVDIARSALPLLFALTSVTAIACAAPTEEDPETLSRSAGTITAETLSGTLGKPKTGSDGSKTGSDGSAKTDAPMKGDESSPLAAPMFELYVPMTREVYEVVSFDFGIVTPSVINASGSSSTPPGALTPLQLAVRMRPGQASPFSVFGGAGPDAVVLRRPASAGGKATPIATFERLGAQSIKSVIHDGTVEEYEVLMGKVSLELPETPGKVVSYDIVTGQTTGLEVCDAIANSPPGFVHGEGVVLPKGKIPIDRAEVQVSYEPDNTGSSSARPRPLLEHLGVEGPMNDVGACAFWVVADPAARYLDTMTIDTVEEGPTGKPVVTPVWQACGSEARDVHFSWRAGEMPRQRLTFFARGLLRTDGTKTTGWSFITKTEITSCAEIS